LLAIERELRARGITQHCTPMEVAPIETALLERVHERAYLQRVREACEAEELYIDVPDCTIGRESFEIARLAAGAAVQAVDGVMSGRFVNAFCALRPPGHHAERNRAMGFCLLNNAAIAARRLLDDYALSRVLLLDWDVHHGNGTQHLFEDDPRVFYISLHGHPGILYPGTGYAHERGVGAGEGFTLNIPLLPPAGDEAYRRAFDELIHPAIESFRPEFILISAGFDAHRLDPLGPLALETESFGWMSDALAHAARRHGGGRLVSFLEGGYHLDALANSVSLHVERLLQAAEALQHP
jgi:acetoin utilization deacetylase AcuC-like enzyme